MTISIQQLVWLFWVIGDAPLLLRWQRGEKWLSPFAIFKMIESILRGFGQVCFANNPFSGLLIILGLVWFDVNVALGALLASFTAFVTSKVLRQSDELVVSGLQNYSAVLVGTVTISLYPMFFQQPLNIYVWLCIAAMGSLSVCVGLGLGALLSRHNLPIFTLPFNVTTSMLFLSLTARYSLGVPVSSEVMQSSLALNQTCWGEMFGGVVKSAGQVYAIEGTVPSIFILVGLMINSPLLTLISFLGALVSSLTALIFASQHAVCSGVWGYNGFLAGGCIIFFVKPSKMSLLIALLNAILTSFIQIALVPVFQANNLPVFTFPFCLSSLLMLALVESIPDLERVNDLTFPEEHLLRSTLKQEEMEVNDLEPTAKV